MGDLWLLGVLAAILAVIITAGGRWERARERHGESGARELPYAGGESAGGSCADGGGCGDGGGGDGGGGD